jgi:hypothetical protein
MRTPSIVPAGEPDVYVVMDDLGKSACVGPVCLVTEPCGLRRNLRSGVDMADWRVRAFASKETQWLTSPSLR